MKPLTLNNDNRRIKCIEEIADFENQSGITFPQSLREFVISYEGSQFQEKYFHTNDILHEINKVLYLKKSEEGGASIEAIIEGHRYYGIEGFIPFGIDSGGWDYNVSVKPESYGQVWVNKFDSGEEDTLEFVCESFEKFINGLSENE